MSILMDYVYVDLIYEDGKVVGANVNLKGGSLDRKMVVMGSTMVTSISIQGERVHSFRVLRPTVIRSMVDVDILAVKLLFAGGATTYSDFIVVDWRKTEPFNLSRGLWMPWMRLGQIVGDRIDVIVGDELFTTHAVGAHKDYPWDNIYEVDANAICSYIADQCGVQQLYDNSTAKIQKADAAERLNNLIASYSKLLGENAELTVRHEKQVRDLQTEVAQLVQKLTAARVEKGELFGKTLELDGRLERVQANFWKERAECAAFETAGKTWYKRYQILRQEILGRRIFAWVLRRLVKNIDTGKEDESRDYHPDASHVLSCLPKEKEEDDEFVAP